MSNTTRALAAVGALAAASLVVAAPAAAEDFEGQYTFDMGGQPALWTVRPCDGGPTLPFNQCVRIAESGGEGAPFEAQANWAVGYWTMRVHRPDVITCEDDSQRGALVTYSWNAASLEGQMGFTYDGSCDDDSEAGSMFAPFQLTRGTPPPSTETADDGEHDPNAGLRSDTGAHEAEAVTDAEANAESAEADASAEAADSGD